MQSHRRPITAAGLAFGLILMALVAVMFMAMPSRANAAVHPRHNHGLTIASTPDPITSGQGVLIYGRLTGPENANRRIWLFHRINPARQFTPIGVTSTDSRGFYEFVRADGVVKTNRNWFVTGPKHTHSRTIHERVHSIVTLAVNASTATTADTVDFTGTVSPAHNHQPVLLQEQDSSAPSGTGWKTIDRGYTNANSGYSIPHRFRMPGSFTLRAYFPNDPRNIAGQSASVAVTVQQEQSPSFTISASAQPLTDGQSETISGTLFADGSTTSVQPNQSVTLYGRTGTGAFKAVQSTSTDSSGDYRFTTTPSYNTAYYVRAGHGEKTAVLYVGVQDVVSASLSSSTLAVGDAVKVTGTVTPDHTGHVIYLQEQNSAGQWVEVQTRYLTDGSRFAFSYTPGMTGRTDLRVQITGGPWSIGGTSATLPLTISGVAPVSSLPPAS